MWGIRLSGQILRSEWRLLELLHKGVGICRMDMGIWIRCFYTTISNLQGLSHSSWKRVWIIQELLKGREVYILCDLRSIEWSFLQAAIRGWELPNKLDMIIHWLLDSPSHFCSVLQYYFPLPRSISSEREKPSTHGARTKAFIIYLRRSQFDTNLSRSEVNIATLSSIDSCV
jgi:hypothetical protein